MTLPMTSLTRAKNGDWFSRKGIPVDVRDDYQRAYGVHREARFRYPPDKSAGEAKAAFAEWLAEVEGRIAVLRSTRAGEARSFNKRQLHGLVGRWYDWFIAQAEHEPPSVHLLDHLYETYEETVQAFGRGGEGEAADQEEASPQHRERIRAKVTELSRLPTFLAMEGAPLDTDTHARLVDTLEPDFVAALALLRRRAEGDYRPDTHREKFPQSMPVAPGGVRPAGINAWEAFQGWVNERKPAKSVVNRWRAVFLDLNERFEQKDVALYSEDDAIAWKDALLVDGTRGSRTVKDIYITSAKTVFGWVMDQRKIATNPFTNVKVAGAKANVAKEEFSDEQVLAILAAALRPQSPRIGKKLRAAYRWVPWLLAYTGARGGEITQLRKQDIKQHRSGFWLISISPDAGTVKGKVSRQVPIHEHLIETGFLDFVRSSDDGPLFYDPPAADAASKEDPLNPKRPGYVIVRQKLGDWVRNTVGIAGSNVSPNHGWRHTFARVGGRANVRPAVLDTICGWKDAAVKRTYQTPTVEDLAEGLKAFPRYPIDAPKTAS